MPLRRRGADRSINSGKLPVVRPIESEITPSIASAEMGAALRQLRRAIEQAQAVVSDDGDVESAT